MSLFEELKRRKVFKVGVGYLVVAWLIVQVASIAFPAFDAPPWALRIFILVLLLGFPISLLFAWAFEVTPDGLKADRAGQGNKRFVLVTVALVALAFAWYFKGQPTVREAISARPAAAPATSAIAPPSAPAASEVDPHSIAVLPFVDMSQQKDQEYFSDGLSEELLNLLAQLPQLRVIARTSSFSFKGKEVDVATIARQLHVAHVLEGSVRKSGNTLRITAQLVRTSDSTHLWSQTYDRELTDVFKVQDEIAAAVVEALKLKLLPGQDMSNAHRSSNAEAYNQYLLGNAFNDRENPDGWRRAISAYDKALALDPAYGAALAGLSEAHARLADSEGDVALMGQALEDARKAIAASPRLADGYISNGNVILSFNRDLAGAKRSFDKALALDPRHPGVPDSYARLLIGQGKLAEAIAMLRQAIERSPLDAGEWGQLGRILNANGDFAAARQALDRSLEINPESNVVLFHRGMNELLQRRPREALAYFDKSGSGYGGAGRTMALHSLGDAQASQRELDAEIAQFAQGGAYQIAEAYAWRGEAGKAFEWLERARVQHDGGLSFLEADPLLASIKHDPRYAAFLKKVGVPE
jgi:TolB-like protein/Tfp pilus assembly protein PilF